VPGNTAIVGLAAGRDNKGTLNQIAATDFGVNSRSLQKTAADHDVVIGSAVAERISPHMLKSKYRPANGITRKVSEV
jgi:hypothetical protein